MANKEANIAAVLPAPHAALVLQEQPLLSPGPGEVLVRNHAIALNPIDWKKKEFNFLINSYPTILGCEIAGVVVAVGPDVTRLKVGDRVAASAQGQLTGQMRHHGHQTYTVASASTALILPDGVSLTQGAAVPLAVETALVALFAEPLGIPLPTITTTTSAAAAATTPKGGLLVWGAGGAVGRATVQLGRLAGMAVFATASPRHHARLRALGAVAVADYASPAAAVDELVAAAAGAGAPISHAVDAHSEGGSIGSACRILKLSGGAGPSPLRLAAVLPPSGDDDAALTKGVELGSVQAWTRPDLSEWMFREAMPGWLERGDFVPSDVRVVPGGLGGIQAGLEELKKGVSGEKLVVEL